MKTANNNARVDHNWANNLVDNKDNDWIDDNLVEKDLVGDNDNNQIHHEPVNNNQVDDNGHQVRLDVTTWLTMTNLMMTTWSTMTTESIATRYITTATRLG